MVNVGAQEEQQVKVRSSPFLELATPDHGELAELSVERLLKGVQVRLRCGRVCREVIGVRQRQELRQERQAGVIHCLQESDQPFPRAPRELADSPALDGVPRLQAPRMGRHAGKLSRLVLSGWPAANGGVKHANLREASAFVPCERPAFASVAKHERRIMTQ